MRFRVSVRTIHADPNPRYFATGRGVTWLNYMSDQFTGLHAIVVPGTLRDSLVILDGLLELQPPGAGGPTTIITDQDLLLRPGLRPLLAAGLPVQPAPRRAARPALLANRPSSRLRPAERARSQRDRPQADHHALGRHPARRRLALDRHRPRLRTAARSARRRQAHAPGPGDRRAGRIAKTLHLLAFVDSDAYRRRIGVHVNRHEGRHSVGRVIFHSTAASCASPTAKARKTNPPHLDSP
jgi:hypothetical protein